MDDDDNQGIHRHDDAPHMVQLGYNLLYRGMKTVAVCMGTLLYFMCMGDFVCTFRACVMEKIIPIYKWWWFGVAHLLNSALVVDPICSYCDVHWLGLLVLQIMHVNNL